jgi:hypothetical protein
MVRIRRFGVVRTATIVAVMYVLIIAIFLVPFGILVVAFGRNDAAGASLLAIVLFGAVAALFYGLIGWIVTAIACAIYNIAAGWVGGIEVELESIAPPPPPPAWGPSSAPPAPPAAG